MSNQIQLVRSEFTELRTGNVEIGYCIFDGYAATYRMYNKDALEKIPDDDGDLLRDVQEASDDVIDGLLEYANEHGILIDGQFYDAEWVRKQLSQ